GACIRDFAVPQVSATSGYIGGTAVASDAADAAPVSGVKVSVVRTSIETVSDAQGTFTLGPLPAGLYDVLLVQTSLGAPPRQRLIAGLSTKAGATTSVGSVAL